MHPSELIGKQAIRTKPVKDGYVEQGFMGMTMEPRMDRRYTTSPVTILAVTESHMVCEWKGEFSGTVHRDILDHRFVDNNWTDYDVLLDMADVTAKAIAEKEYEVVELTQDS